METMALETLRENPQFEGVMDIHPQEVHRIAQRVRMIDVRQPEEYAGELGHIAGSTLMPLDTLPEVLANYHPKDQIIFVCRSGNRSARAAAFASSIGFENVFNMKGGMLLWNELHLPTVKE